MAAAAEKKRLVGAFTLTSLHQLALVKSWDGTTSVLDYLLAELFKVDPDLLRLAEDFSDGKLDAAKRLPLDVMQANVDEIRTSREKWGAWRKWRSTNRSPYSPPPPPPPQSLTSKHSSVNQLKTMLAVYRWLQCSPEAARPSTWKR